jgi:hypothetical protein
MRSDVKDSRDVIHGIWDREMCLPFEIAFGPAGKCKNARIQDKVALRIQNNGFLSGGGSEKSSWIETSFSFSWVLISHKLYFISLLKFKFSKSDCHIEFLIYPYEQKIRHEWRLSSFLIAGRPLCSVSHLTLTIIRYFFADHSEWTYL